MNFNYGRKELDALKSKDKKLGAVIDRIDFLERETDPDLFASVVHCIIGQQISTKAQQTIWDRMNHTFGAITPETIWGIAAEDLQSMGISLRKVNYIKDLSNKILCGEFSPQTIEKMSDSEAITALSELKGVGVWTAEMILIFCLQRPDILSYDDLGIQRGMRMIYQVPVIDRPFFEKIRNRLSPYGSIASLYFWAVAGGAIPDLEDPAAIRQYTCSCSSPLGNLTLASDGHFLTGLWFDGQKNYGSTLTENPLQKEIPVFRKTIRWLDSYFSGKNPSQNPQIRLKTTPFRRNVLEIVRTIPYGETRTYQEIAKRLEHPEESGHVCTRSVAGAIAHNPIMIIIPCHRVLGSDGKLTGYAAGIERKNKLLSLENKKC